MSRQRKPLLYLLGPMNGFLDYNRPAFHKWAAFLRAEGFDVFNPAELDEIVGEAQVYADYYRRDAEFMAKVDGGAAMPGWKGSKGATWEAYSIGIMFQKPVYLLPDLALIVPDELPRLQHPETLHPITK